MCLRTLLAVLALLLAAAPAAHAQDTYDALSEREVPYRPGVRLGLGAGAYVYTGPDALYGTLDQRDVTRTRPAVTAHLAVPLYTDRLYGRFLGGMLNLGGDAIEGVAEADNLFLSRPVLLLEGNLLVNLLSYAQSPVVPYVYSGLGTLIADPFGGDFSDRKRVALALPLGLGLDVPLSRSVSLFAEGSYRFLLNNVSADPQVLADEFENSPIPQELKEFCDKFPQDPVCKREVSPDVLARYDRRFGSALLLGGLQFSFNRPPPPPPRVVERVVYVETPAPTPEPEPEPRRICTLVELNAVYFDYGSAALSPQARSLLAENLQQLLDEPECCVFLDGYVDAAEMDRFGMPIGSRRAQAVYDYYVDGGVDPERLQVRNRGVSLPDCDKEDPEIGCRRGRRVDSTPMDCERFLRTLGN